MVLKFLSGSFQASKRIHRPQQLYLLATLLTVLTWLFCMQGTPAAADVGFMSAPHLTRRGAATSTGSATEDFLVDEYTMSCEDLILGNCSAFQRSPELVNQPKKVFMVPNSVRMTHCTKLIPGMFSKCRSVFSDITGLWLSNVRCFFGADVLRACGEYGFGNKIDHVPRGVFTNVDLPSLHSLTLMDVGLETVEDGAFADVGATLLDLTLVANSIERIGSETLAGLSTLLQLELSGNGIKVIEVNAFDDSPDLTQLLLSNNQLDGTNMRGWLADWAFRLQLLDLSNNRLTQYDAAVFARIPFLHTLRLNGNPLKRVINAVPNQKSDISTTVNLRGTKLSRPSHFNSLGLSAPTIVLPEEIPVHCRSNLAYEQTNEYVNKQVFSTKCECLDMYAVQGGRCVSLLPAVVVLGMLGGGLFGAGLAIMYRRLKKARRLRLSMERDIEMKQRLLTDYAQDNEELRRAWLVDAEDVVREEKLASGGFGDVYRGRWNTLPVAIKVMRHSLVQAGGAEFDDFGREVEFLMRCKHPNIVLFFGAGQQDGVPFLLMEFMSNGTLSSYLDDATKPLDWALRLQFASDIAAGLCYVHSRGGLHRDVKSSNVLLDDRLRCKLTDFGTVKDSIVSRSSAVKAKRGRSLIHASSRHYSVTVAMQQSLSENGQSIQGKPLGRAVSANAALHGDTPESLNAGAIPEHSPTNPFSYERTPSWKSDDLLLEEEEDFCDDSTSYTMTMGIGTPLYMAPEVLRGEQYHQTADVFSFALLLWHIAARREPDIFQQLAKKGKKFKGGSVLIRLEQLYSNGHRMDIDEAWPPLYSHLIRRCWQDDPKTRPHFGSIAEQLTLLILAEQEGRLMDEPDTLAQTTV